ncbi:MAG: hypothetical protein ACYC1E_17960 [Propionibacteriaceae bacterium]
MSSSRDRIEARRAIQERASARRRAREQKEARIAELAVTIKLALGQGRRAVELAEREAGAALALMIDHEGLTVTEALEWIGDPTLTMRELGRLRAHTRHDAKDPTGGRAE